MCKQVFTRSLAVNSYAYMLGAITDFTSGDLGIVLQEKDIDKIKQKTKTAETIPSPIVLDLNGDGVQTTALSQSRTGTAFDHANDGFAEQTGWVGQGDGLLVRDLNNNGLIDSGRELFGSETLLTSAQNQGQKAANGFEALRQLYSNANGKIDAGDTGFASLRIWKDDNSDAITDEGELLALEEAGVQSINVAYTASSVVDAQGNAHRQTGSYTTTTGLTRKADDVWFAADQTNHNYINKNFYYKNRIRLRPYLLGRTSIRHSKTAQKASHHTHVTCQREKAITPDSGAACARIYWARGLFDSQNKQKTRRNQALVHAKACL